MTEAKPFTQRKIEQRQVKSRRRFGFFVSAKPKPGRAGAPSTTAGDIGQRIACPWNFDEAIGILARQPGCRIKTADDRARCKNEIALIFHLYQLERLAETQETNAAKASAFQRAPRWYKRRQRAITQLEKLEGGQAGGQGAGAGVPADGTGARIWSTPVLVEVTDPAERLAIRKDARLAQQALAELGAIPCSPFTRTGGSPAAGKRSASRRKLPGAARPIQGRIKTWTYQNPTH